MKARLVQKDCNNPEIQGWIRQAELDGVDLLCFGELASSGCLYQPRTVPALDSVLALLEPFQIRIMLGLPYESPEGLRNAYVYYHRGQHQIYHKVNLIPLMNEPDVYVPGESPGIFDTDFGKAGTAICYDVRFPDLFQQVKQAGAEYLFVPAAFPLVRIDAWRENLTNRAKETGLTTIGINAVGDDGTNVFGGNSMVIDKDGTILHETDQTSETILDFEL